MRRPVQDVTNAQKWLLPPLKSTGRGTSVMVMVDDGPVGFSALSSANTTCSLLLSFFGGSGNFQINGELDRELS